MDHFTITFRPDGKQISIHAGATLVEAAGQAGIVLNTVCGGRGTCKKCLVLLEPDSRQVLACQHRVENDLTVAIPPGSRLFEERILTEGIDARSRIRPDLYKDYVRADPNAAILGVALDIGTTTVVAKLIDMRDGQCRATEAALNPQTRCGDDVVSRIAYARTDREFAELHQAIIDCINALVEKLCKKAAVAANQIYELCAVGNTTMNHIFLKLPIAQLGQAPYRAWSLDAHDVRPGDLGVRMNPAGNVHTVENIAGFVGADTTAVALAADIDAAEEMTLIVDIGTNGEIVLGTKERLYAASCAAGPALEGARITCGSRAAEGAIEAVVVNGGDMDLDVIGGCPPHSICGSGLIDAAAVMLDLGVIDATGRFVEPARLREKLPSGIFSRLVERDGQPAFSLASCGRLKGKAFGHGRPAKSHPQAALGDATARQVLLTQRDIRQMQLAKGAIRAGIKCLQRRMDLNDSDIKQVLLAGAFGNYIRPASALRIGLLPAVAVERIRFVGNAAASGAQMTLVSRSCRRQARQLARKMRYIEIAHEPGFQTLFADSMLFDG